MLRLLGCPAPRSNNSVRDHVRPDEIYDLRGVFRVLGELEPFAVHGELDAAGVVEDVGVSFDGATVAERAVDVLHRIDVEGGARRVLVGVSRVIVHGVAGEPEGFFAEDRDVRLVLI
jgi:hypothetical protein